jgi:UDP-N-acetylglucosamine 2-epimerase
MPSTASALTGHSSTDTNSTLGGAAAALAAGVPVAHVEAGLRSGDWSMPEEHNRVKVDRIATLLLCPDERSRETLEREGAPGRAEVVGDVMADACFGLTPTPRTRETIRGTLKAPTSKTLAFGTATTRTGQQWVTALSARRRRGW